MALLVVGAVSAVATPVAAAGTTEVSLAPGDQSVAAGISVTYDVVVESPDGGVGSYEFEVAVSNTSTARITAATDRTGASLASTTVASDGSSADLKAVTGGYDPTGAAVVASITVTGEDAGTASLTFEESVVGDGDSQPYTITAVNDGRVTVEDGPSNDVDLELRPDDDTVGVGESTAFDLVATNVTDGVGSYDVRVNASALSPSPSAPSPVAITSATDRLDSAVVDVRIADGNDSVRILAAGADAAGTGTVTLATVTVAGEAGGDATLRFGDRLDVGDEDNTRYAIGDTSGASVTVAAGPPPLAPGLPAPTDPDGDDRYEDVNGDGELDVLDVGEFLDRFDGDAVQNNARFFDFDGQGGVDILDVTALLDRL